MDALTMGGTCADACNWSSSQCVSGTFCPYCQQYHEQSKRVLSKVIALRADRSQYTRLSNTEKAADSKADSCFGLAILAEALASASNRPTSIPMPTYVNSCAGIKGVTQCLPKRQLASFGRGYECAQDFDFP